MTHSVFALALALTALPASALAQVSVQRPAPSAAPAPTSSGALASARSLIHLMRVDKTIEGMVDTLAPLMANATVGTLESQPETATVMKAMAANDHGRERVLTIFREEFTTEFKKAVPTLLERTAQEYAAAFSEAELSELVTFYSGGTGRKVITLLPALQQKMADFGQETGFDVGFKAGERAMLRALDELSPAQQETKS